MPTREELIDYYSRKESEYLGKYLLNDRAHAHVGIYDPERQPELFRSGWVDSDLGVDRLKMLMHLGQERSVSELFQLASEWLTEPEPKTLDCGAGLGGTSILLAERYGLRVDALTIVPSQGRHIQREADRLNLAGLVTARVGDVFSPDDWRPSKPYGLIMSFDAFSQMGRKETVFDILARTQRAGGVLAFSDHYVASRTSEIAAYYNKYWVSEISSLQETVSALTAAGYRIRYLRDRTDRQIPYWGLSVAYSEITTSDRSTARRLETKSFHEAMKAAHHGGDMQYYQVVASKV
ncbi:class I SAM-dependent methyltransferase [Amycolatopsis sp. NPDC051128]|uniref:SAM-dependent methyltransferase n=1 Tax=Amycolatopsis sp. NPDC051128 TaxID=3155412 RepID=UPI0034317A35